MKTEYLQRRALASLPKKKVLAQKLIKQLDAGKEFQGSCWLIFLLSSFYSKNRQRSTTFKPLNGIVMYKLSAFGQLLADIICYQDIIHFDIPLVLFLKCKMRYHAVHILVL